MALGLVIGALAAAYVLPRLGATVWGYSTTWVGKTFATWAVLALLYDFLLNTGDDTFTEVDLVITALIPLGARAVM